MPVPQLPKPSIQLTLGISLSLTELRLDMLQTGLSPVAVNELLGDVEGLWYR